QPRPAPAGVIPADLRAGGRVARPCLLPGTQRCHSGAAGRAADAGSRQRAHAAAPAGPARASAVRGARAHGHRAAGLLPRPGHREHARLRLLLLLDLDSEDRARDLVADEAGELLVEPERLLAELVQRVLLGVAAE